MLRIGELLNLDISATSSVGRFEPYQLQPWTRGKQGLDWCWVETPKLHKANVGYPEMSHEMGGTIGHGVFKVRVLHL